MAERVVPREWPTIETDRLRLRGATMDDAPSVQRFCDDYEVSRNAETIPHPYTLEHAATWVRTVLEEFEQGVAVGMLIETRSDGVVIGDTCLTLDAEHGRAEVGFVLGRVHWGKGYATEAVRAMIGWGFRALGLRKVCAVAFADNAPSRRVLEKCGMRLEVELRGHTMSEGSPRDDVVYGLLKEEYDGGGGERAKEPHGQMAR